jgi:hypothetical protein
MPLEVDLTELDNPTRQSIHRLVADEGSFQIMQARLRQEGIAKFYRDNQPRSIEGVGEQTMAIDPFWIGYFNAMHRRQVWADPDFRKWLTKEDDVFRVKSRSGKLQVGWVPSSERSTFHKSYEL